MSSVYHILKTHRQANTAKSNKWQLVTGYIFNDAQLAEETALELARLDTDYNYHVTVVTISYGTTVAELHHWSDEE